MTSSDFLSKTFSVKDKYNLSHLGNLVPKSPTAKLTFGYPTVTSNSKCINMMDF